MLKLLFNIYSLIFSRPIFIRLNRLLFHLSLRGLGILNYQNFRISGEEFFLKKILNDNDPVVFDIGANEGVFSQLVKSINASVAVHAFEPHPKTFQKLQKISGNSIFTHNLALGKEEAVLNLYDYTNRDGSTHASLYQGAINVIHRSQSISHEVKVTTLDKFTQDHDLNRKPIDLLKIDAEGHEYDVLRGAQNLLKQKKIKIIQFEFNELNIVSRVFLKDFFDLLEDYKIFRILRKGLMPIPYDSIHEIFLFQNLVAVHNAYTNDYKNLFKDH